MDEERRTTPPPPAQDTTLAAGTLVGRYVVLDIIGRGGMGVVYAAYDAQLGRKVAIKLLRTSLASLRSADVQARILREAQAMARLSHPNVVGIYDVGAYGDDNVFLAMDLVEGSTLKEWLETPRSWKEVLEVLKQAGRGLAAAHAAGLVHRDFKPDNVLIGIDGRARVTDFGIARTDRAPDTLDLDDDGNPSHPQAAASSATSSQGIVLPLPPLAPLPPPIPLSGATPPVIDRTPSGSGRHDLSDPITMTGTILGTVGYMPPEQGLSEASDARSDQFSFCVTMYIALYGERPYPGESMADYLNALERHVVVPPKSSGVPAWVRRIVLKGLSRKPEERFASMEALLDALEQDPARARRRLLSWAAVGAVAVAAVVGYRRYVAHEQQICAADESMLAGAWDHDVRDRVHRAFVGTGTPYAEETFQRVAQKLDAVAHDWKKTHTDACQATLIRHEKSMDVMAMRMACLDRSKTELAALTSVFSKADPQVMKRAVAATFGLAEPSSCANVNGLQASLGLPEDPAMRERVLAVRAEVARAESLRLSGKLHEALAVAEPTLERARAIPHAETEAEVLYSIGMTRELLGDYAGTEQVYQEAVWAGERAGNDAIMARASARLAFVLGDKLSRMPEAQSWASLGAAAVVRLGANDDVEGDVLGARAVLFTAVGRPELAVAMGERLVGIREKTLGPNHLETARAMNNLGYTYQLMGQQERALPLHLSALSTKEAILGVDDPACAVDYSNLGATQLGLGRYEDAISTLHHANEVASNGNRNNFWLAWTSAFLSVAHTRSGDPAAGLLASREGLAVADNLPGERQRVMAPLLVSAGIALLAEKQPQAARDECARALAMQEEEGKLDAERVYVWDALTCVGEAELALGKPREALVPLERSVRLTRRVMPGDLARAKFALARALAETGDAARARALAEQAKEELSALPAHGDALEPVEAFLAANAPR